MDAVLFHDAAETEKFSVGHGELLFEVVDCRGGVDHALSSHVLGPGTPYELSEVGVELAVTAGSFAGGADDDDMEGFADIRTLFG